MQEIIPKALPWDLLELEELVNEQVKEGKAFYSSSRYYNCIQNAMRLHSDSKDPVIVLVIAQHWVNHFQSCIVNKDGNEIYLDELDRFIKFLSEHKITKNLARDESNANVIAHLLMARVAAAEGRDKHPEYDNAGDVLKQWAGNDSLDPCVIQTLEALVVHMYGEPVWDLYIAGLDWFDDIPMHLWDEKVPLAAPFKENKIDESVSIPIDLF